MPSSKAGPVTMATIAEKLDTVCDTVNQTKTVVDDLKATQIQQAVHISQIIGPPSLEERIRTYVDDRDTHKANNATQALIQTQTILEQEIKIMKLELEKQTEAIQQRQTVSEQGTDRRHQENRLQAEAHDKRISKLERAFWMGMGGWALVWALVETYFKVMK